MSVGLLLLLNRLFPLPRHPFNLESAGQESYAEWQFRMGQRTIEFFLDYTSPADMFADRRVLDVGSGGGGKTCYYATLGAQEVWGVDAVEAYRDRAEAFSAEKGLADRTTFIAADARHLPFEDDSFDTIIMNDTFEHLAAPEAVLGECRRVLAPSGRIFINFPPYYHPHGAHLTDAIGIPWVHVLFSEKTLVRAYRRLVSDLPDGEERLALRLGEDPESEGLAYLNAMTAGRFRRIIAASDMRILHYREYPLRRFMTPLTRIPGLREGFLRMGVAVLSPKEGPLGG